MTIDTNLCCALCDEREPEDNAGWMEAPSGRVYCPVCFEAAFTRGQAVDIVAPQGDRMTIDTNLCCALCDEREPEDNAGWMEAPSGRVYCPVCFEAAFTRGQAVDIVAPKGEPS